ncbi:IS4 family transposase [Actinomadura rubrisoli]|uniref:IS4 family transposase n=1 Tax=Actinomadura rubrisoli TaxID=2530368 RepID=UPI001FB74D3E|nr:IS4 family transposase [Actinomadura rubrisoli]
MTERIGIGVLTRIVPRELVDEVILESGRREQRLRKLPARVVVYFVMAMTLFHGESYEEVMRKLVQGLRWLGSWRAEWTIPTPAALTQARQRLGNEVMRNLFERVAVPCALRSTKGAWLGRWRLMALDGFDVEVFDSPANGDRFGFSGKKKNEKGVFPKALVVGLAECGTHAIVAAELGAQRETEVALATRLLATDAVGDDMLIIADKGMYSHENMKRIKDGGADALFRAKMNNDLPILEWLPDGSYLSYSADPRRKMAAYERLRRGTIKISDLPGFPVRVFDYQVLGQGDEDELFTLVTTILDPEQAPAAGLAAAYHERWEIELVIDEVKTHQKGPGALLRSKTPELAEQELWGFLLSHYAVRKLMTEAADQADIDPDRLSFIRSLRVVRRQITGPADFSPEAP